MNLRPDEATAKPDGVREGSAAAPSPPGPGREANAEDPLLWFPAEGERRAGVQAGRGPARRPRVWWWIGLAAVLVAGAAVAAWFFVYRPQAAPMAPATLSVESQPPGASVLVDGQPRGVTPVAITVDAGPHLIQVENVAGRREIRRTLEPGAKVFEYVELPASLTGRLTVDSRPPGAQVIVDGTLRGVTPLEVGDLAPGSHAVTLRNAASSVDESVAIVAGVTASIVVPLGASTAGFGWMSLPVPFVLQIFEGGRLVGTSETERIMMAAGPHALELVNEDLGFRVARQVDVPPAATARVAITLPNGVLHVNAVPWAEVSIDGRRLGETPLANLQVPIGPHELVFRNPQFPEQRRSVTVRLTQPTRLGVDLRR